LLDPLVLGVVNKVQGAVRGGAALARVCETASWPSPTS
jgi:hypothetical protein